MPCKRLQIGPLTGFVCSRGKSPTCSEKGCNEHAPYLCDHPIKPRIKKGGAKQTTCDRKLCEKHRVQVGEDLDHCPHHAKAAGTVERRPLVLKLELTLRQAPTMNEYAAAKRNRRYMAKRNKEVDTAIMFAKATWPRWKMDDLVVIRNHAIVKGKLRKKETRTGGRRRLVVVHRYSSREPDEISCDVIGGKLPVDRLVQAEVLVDDNRKWLEREARWSMAPPNHGRVVLSVYEIPASSPDRSKKQPAPARPSSPSSPADREPHKAGPMTPSGSSKAPPKGSSGRGTSEQQQLASADHQSWDQKEATGSPSVE